MVIIDKRKDYYDYLQGVIGQDPKAVYDRRNGICMTTDTLPYGFQQALPPGIDGYLGIAHLFCGNIVYAFFFENYGNGVASELILSKRIKRTSMVPMRIAISTQIWKEPSVGSDRWTRKYHSQSEYKRRIIDGEKHRSQWSDYQDEEEVVSVFYPNHPVWYDNPILVSLPIPIVPAEDLFLNLQEFILSQNDKPIVDNRTDRQKLEAAGFDNSKRLRVDVTMSVKQKSQVLG